MTQRVGIEFDGQARGAVGAARQAAGGIEQVKRSASGARAPLRGLDEDLGRATRGAIAGSGAFRGLQRSIATVTLGYGAAFGLTAVLRGAADELVNQVKVNARVAAALRSTGGIAGVTAGQIDELAQAELRKTGIDDEVIKGAETMLLRFTQVRNVAGAQNDIFTRATRTSLDLAQALGRDATDAAFALGKALNDPTRGVQQLRRVGAAFTAEDAKQIKQLAEHGRVLDAQKKILDALTRSYGGTAQAVANAAPWMRLRETLKNLSAEAIRPLLPQLNTITTRVQKWADELEHNQDLQRRWRADLEAAIGTVKDVAQAADTVAGAVGGWRRALELLLALKLASTLSGWTTAIAAFTGAEAAGTGVAGAAGATGLLNKRLGLLRTLTSKPFQLVIAYEIIRKITGSGADLSDAAGGAGDLLPVYQNGKWVDPTTGTPVADQAYWNRYYKQSGGAGAPTAGQTAGGAGGGSSKQQALVRTALAHGPGSGGVYVTGGTGGQFSTAGGGVREVYDCSGYLYDIYRRNGITIPRTTETQWADPNAIKVPPGQEQPGDGVYFEARGNGYAAPGHCGIYIGNGRFIEYYSSGKPARVSNLRDRSDYWGARRWVKVKQRDTGGKGAAPPTSGPPTAAASTNALPARIRQAVSAAGVAVAAAALTPGKADDRAAIAEQRAAVDQEIAWLRSKLATNLGAEKRITLEDLLTGALGELAGLQKTPKGPRGAGIATITTLRTAISEQLRDLPLTLDTVEQQAVTKLQKLRDHLKVGMSAKDLATTRAQIRHWGSILKDEISAQAKVAADAAQEASRLWQRTWQTDVDRILRDYRETVVDKQLGAFDRETTGALKRMQDDVQAQLAGFDRDTQTQLKEIAARYAQPTVEEQALTAFRAARDAAAEAKRRTDIQSQIADTQSQLAALGVTATGGGVLIDIATGKRNVLDQTATDVVDKQKQLTQQLLDLQEQYHQLDLDDQERALQASADASRRAADDQAAAEEQAHQDSRDRLRQSIEDDAAVKQQGYQDDRDSQRQHLQDMLDDQTVALQQNLDDWNVWLDAKKKSWGEFIQWLANNGYTTTGIANPGASGGGVLGPVGDDVRAAMALARATGRAVAMQEGGTVPGTYVGRADTILLRATPGEHMLDRQLSEDLRDFLASGGRAGPVVAVFKINDREFARAVADPVSDEQARRLGIPIQRG